MLACVLYQGRLWRAVRERTREVRFSDHANWKMSPEQLQEHLKLRTRARRIPDKKKQYDRRACRNTRRALPACRDRLLAPDADGQRILAQRVLQSGLGAC